MACDLLIEKGLVEFLLSRSESVIASDGWSTTPGGPTGGGHPHPRCYGTFPHVLARYVREPHQFAEGIHWVVVDGHLTLDRKVLSDRLAGTVLTPTA
jgi:hypothetical protein